MVEKGNCNNLNFKYSFADITFHLFYPQGVWRNFLVLLKKSYGILLWCFLPVLFLNIVKLVLIKIGLFFPSL